MVKADRHLATRRGIDPHHGPSPLRGLIHVGYEVPDPRRWCVARPRGSADWVIIYTVQGSGQYDHADTPLQAGPGMICLARPSTPHWVRVAPGYQHWKHYWVHFQPRPHWLHWLDWSEHATGLRTIQFEAGPERRGVTAALRRCLALFLGGRPDRELFALHALEEVLLWCRAAAGKGEDDALSEAAVQHFSAHLAQPVNLQDVARATSQSVSRLSHRFKEKMGLSPRAFLEQQRMDRAKQLLALTPAPVKQVAAEVGFSNPFYFSLRFRKATGQSPTEFRQTSLTAPRTRHGTGPQKKAVAERGHRKSGD